MTLEEADAAARAEGIIRGFQERIKALQEENSKLRMDLFARAQSDYNRGFNFGKEHERNMAAVGKTIRQSVKNLKWFVVKQSVKEWVKSL